MRRPRGGRPQRPIGTREPRRVVWILTEGKKTEPSYFKDLERRNPTVHIEIKDPGKAPTNLVRKARKYQKSNRRLIHHGEGNLFEEIWCVFDVDEHPNLSETLTEASKHEISVALSNPCFELWLLLHFENRTTYIHRHESQRRAKELGILHGKNIRPNQFGALFANYKTAKQRAQALTEQHKKNGSKPNENPSSDVWKLVDRLRDEH